ncbi:MAG: universal stress protein [Alphaproteobacteria bacterium]|nr:universal stress protein [Alphaproteobacteria bacterium]
MPNKQKTPVPNKGTYLVVADGSAEFLVAELYAAGLAKAHGAHPAIVRVIEPQDFMHWGGIESKMKAEMREEAERAVWEAARTMGEMTGVIPSVYIEEGDKLEVLSNIIANDANIKMLILAGDTAGSNPGPLTSYFTSKGLAKLRVPVLIIPGHLSSEDIEALV